MTYPPPVAANGDYSSHSTQNVTYLPPTAAGGAVPGPDAAGEIQGRRRAGRRSPFGRLRRRPPHDGPEAVAGQRAAAGVFAAASPHPEYADGPADPAARVAGYRPLHRADRAEHHGISWSAARPGPVRSGSGVVGGDQRHEDRHRGGGHVRGRLGGAGAYLPGRRVTGVAVRDQGIEVHVIGRYSVPVGTIAAEVRRAAEPFASGYPVHVIIEDLA